MPAIFHRTVPGARCASRLYSGVKTLTSSFLNAALGCLFASFSVDTLTRKLKYIGLDPTDEKLVRLVVSNAIRFYAATPEQQQAMAAATS